MAKSRYNSLEVEIIFSLPRDLHSFDSITSSKVAHLKYTLSVPFTFNSYTFFVILWSQTKKEDHLLLLKLFMNQLQLHEVDMHLARFKRFAVHFKPITVRPRAER